MLKLLDKIDRLASSRRRFLKFIRRMFLKKRILFNPEIIRLFPILKHVHLWNNKNHRQNWSEYEWYLKVGQFDYNVKTSMSLVTCMNCGYESYILCCSPQPFLLSFCAGCLPNAGMPPNCQICSKSTMSIFNSIRYRLRVTNHQRNLTNQQYPVRNRGNNSRLLSLPSN